MMMCHYLIIDGQDSLNMVNNRASISADRLNIFNNGNMVWPSTTYLLGVDDSKSVD